MASNALSILLRKVDEKIRVGEIKVAPRGLGGVPLHRVLGRHLAEILLDDGGGLALLHDAIVARDANVELAFGLEELVDAGGGLAGEEVGGGVVGGVCRAASGVVRVRARVVVGGGEAEDGEGG